MVLLEEIVLLLLLLVVLGRIVSEAERATGTGAKKAVDGHQQSVVNSNEIFMVDNQGGTD